MVCLKLSLQYSRGMNRLSWKPVSGHAGAQLTSKCVPPVRMRVFLFDSLRVCSI
jgi:hypothetical protein